MSHPNNRNAHGREGRQAPKILFLVTEDWYFCSHRLPLACAARDDGFEVIVASRVQEHAEQIRKEGFRLIPIRLRRRNRNPFRGILSVAEIFSIYRAERPDIVHHVSMQPVLYGTAAARLARVPAVVNALAGMGYVFSSSRGKAKLLRRVISGAFRLLLNHPRGRVIVQNPDDLKMLERENIVKQKFLVLIKGSGVDIEKFSPKDEQREIPLIVLASRMLWAKGVGEFVDAARQLRQDGVSCRIVLVGTPDPENPASIPEETLRGWHSEGIVEWWGHREDMPEVFAQSNIVVLPTTYGEGVPKVLLEAASCGRTIVATDVPGCREIVRHNENGLLVPPHDAQSLANALKILIEDPELRARMGARGREIVEAEFSEEKVVLETMKVYGELLKQ